MNIIENIQFQISEIIYESTGQKIDNKSLVLSPTKKEFTGDYTLLVFPLTRYFGKSPEETGKLIGENILKKSEFVLEFNIIKGFLNFTCTPDFWIAVLSNIIEDMEFGRAKKNGQKVMVEFSSPNTNKPLHLGHIRNILLGWSVNKILDFAGYDVIKTQIVNDRGIAICKSMLAWEKFGNKETPESQHIKGDLFVGNYYVMFDQKLNEEYSNWQKTMEAQLIFSSQNEISDSEVFFKKYKNDYFNQFSKLGSEARELLLNWEKKDEPTIELWKNMNTWVLSGFEETYKKLKVSFDKTYYESDTYLLGKNIVEEGLNKSVFYKEEDGSVWINLENVGMDRKIILRSDGTSVYITQDMGTADLRYQDFGTEKMIYVVGNEQDYHFKVLFEVMNRLGRPYAGGLYHLSYGMVELPSGKMKSREGTVVDADDLIAEVIAEARKSAEERGEIEGLSEDEKSEIYSKIGIAALKYFILKVGPQKKMVFNPEESVDMQGQTGPYIQNAYVRIQSIFRKAGKNEDFGDYSTYTEINEFEKSLLSSLEEYPSVIEQAAEEYSPALLSNYLYELAKRFHKFYAEVKVITAETEKAKNFRLSLSSKVADVIRSGLDLLGIEVMERM
jgi:arginyl-tRNA synthetase